MILIFFCARICDSEGRKGVASVRSSPSSYPTSSPLSRLTSSSSSSFSPLIVPDSDKVLLGSPHLTKRNSTILFNSIISFLQLCNSSELESEYGLFSAIRLGRVSMETFMTLSANCRVDIVSSKLVADGDKVTTKALFVLPPRLS